MNGRLLPSNTREYSTYTKFNTLIATNHHNSGYLGMDRLKTNVLATVPVFDWVFFTFITLEASFLKSSILKTCLHCSIDFLFSAEKLYNGAEHCSKN